MQYVTKERSIAKRDDFSASLNFIYDGTNNILAHSKCCLPAMASPIIIWGWHYLKGKGDAEKSVELLNEIEYKRINTCYIKYLN